MSTLHRLIFIGGLVATLLLTYQYVSADCQPNNLGTPADDVIDCDTVPAPPGLVTVSGGVTGNDTITTQTGTNVGIVMGDSNGNAAVNVSGNDAITVNGDAVSVTGDFLNNGVNGGNDQIIINGNVSIQVDGDIYGLATGGNDVIIVNGTVRGAVNGDYTTSSSPIVQNVGGDDQITINGTVSNISGDNLGSNGVGGDDTITINQTGSVNLVFGDGQGVVVGGNDTVVVSVGATAYNINGGPHTTADTLQFVGSTNDEAGWNQLQSFVGCNPCAGTVTIDGKIYTFTNFEQFVNVVILNSVPQSVVAVNFAPAVPVYPQLLCDNGAVKVFATETSLEIYAGFFPDTPNGFLIAAIPTLDILAGNQWVSSTANWSATLLESGFIRVLDGNGTLVNEDCRWRV